MGNDLLMGRLDLTPVLDAHVRCPYTNLPQPFAYSQ